MQWYTSPGHVEVMKHTFGKLSIEYCPIIIIVIVIVIIIRCCLAYFTIGLDDGLTSNKQQAFNKLSSGPKMTSSVRPPFH